MVESKMFKWGAQRVVCFSAGILFSASILCLAPAHTRAEQTPEGRPLYQNASIDDSEYLKNPQQCPSSEMDIRDDAVRAGLLYDLSARRIIWEKNMNQAFPIASLTKMMVGLLVVEDIQAGKVGWATRVTVTPEATRAGGFTVSLRPGRSISVEDLMKAALISSGNDAAYQLAQFLGKTERNFVRRMNRRAAELGMNATCYTNSTGMPAARSCNDNHASPADLLILCKEMYKYKDLMRIAGTSEELISQGGRVIKLRNHNHLVADFIEVDGFKTGYTNNARFCLAATASKEGRRIISIALGVGSRQVRDRFVKNIFCRYYDALGMGSLQPKGGHAVAASRTINTSPRVTATTVVYRIKKGDTLSGVARAYGCSVSQLKQWNGIRRNLIKPGRQLKIYQHQSKRMYAAKAKSNRRSVIHYTVKPGDTLWRISQKYNGLTVKELMKANNIRQAANLKVGATIKIHLDRDNRSGKVL